MSLKTIHKTSLITLVLIITISSTKIHAQLGLCEGNSGDPIFKEDFGSGTSFGPQLTNNDLLGTTTYNYTVNNPIDGEYTIHNNTNYYSWHDLPEDHTEGDTDGKMLIVNSNSTQDEFYLRRVSGLCEETTYEFSSWIINLSTAETECPGGFGPIPINIKFEIWDATNTTLLKAGTTEHIFSTSIQNPEWLQKGLVFQTLAGQNEVILKIINIGDSGCGNDLALDDIVFKTCGDLIEITDANNNNSQTICEVDIPIDINLMAIPDGSVFNTYVYQWQESSDGINWLDITDETNQQLSTQTINTTSYFRVKVAESMTNLLNTSCITLSEIYSITIDNNLMSPTANPINCETGIISVSVPTGGTANWYDAPTGGVLLQSNSTTYLPPSTGTFYAEMVSAFGCIFDSRTAITKTAINIPTTVDEENLLCDGEQLTLKANPSPPDPTYTYLWNTGETTPQITINIGGNYSVIVSNTDGCSSTKNFTIQRSSAPKQITQNDIEIIITNNNNTIIINNNNLGTGDYEFALDSTSNYQDSPIFNNIAPGKRTIYIRDKNGCKPDTSLVISIFGFPKFFTPNNDGQNDYFQIKEFDTNTYQHTNISIFDRFGKLITSFNTTSKGWNGFYNGIESPATDYWYKMELTELNGNTTLLRGHFSLIR